MLAYDISLKYMIAGYSVILIVLAVYLTSLVLRFRRLRRDKQLLGDQESK